MILDVKSQDSDFGQFRIIFNSHMLMYCHTGGWKKYTKKKLHIYMYIAKNHK